MAEAGKKWAAMGPDEKKRFQDEAQAQKQRYLEYKRALREQAAQGGGNVVPDEEEQQD